MLSRDGIGSFSLRRLSRELGVSHAAAYRHFTGREDLLRAILIESSMMFRDALASSVSPDARGMEALYQLGTGYVRFYIEHPETLSLFTLIPSENSLLETILGSMNSNDPEAAELGFHADFPELDSLPENSAFGIFRNIASAARESEIYGGLSEREILLGFWSKVHGMATLLASQKNFIPGEDLDAVIEKVVRTPF